MIIERRIFSSLCKEIADRKPSILLGARQTGKTFLLKELERKAGAAGLATRFFDLEIPQDLAAFNKPDDALFRMLTERPGVVFIDEFHYLPNASKLFKAVFDSGKEIKIFASGSSALEMHRHLKESLAGRRLTTQIHPLAYEEYLTGPAAQRPSKSLEEYVVFGGLPGVALCRGYDERIRLLQDILETYIQKDVNAATQDIIQAMPGFRPGRGLLSFCFVDPFAADLDFDVIRTLGTRYRMDFLILLMLGRDIRTNFRRYFDDPDDTRIGALVDDPHGRDEWRAGGLQPRDLVRFLLE
jgi:hypothetical protein